MNIWGNGSMLGGQAYIAEDFNFSDTKNTDNYKPVGFTLPNSTNWASAMGYGSEEYDWLIMPSESNGASNLPIGDILTTIVNLNGYKTAMHSGASYNGQGAGIFRYCCDATINGRGVHLSGRLMYVPQN